MVTNMTENTFGSWTPYEENVSSAVLREILFLLMLEGCTLKLTPQTARQEDLFRKEACLSTAEGHEG